VHGTPRLDDAFARAAGIAVHPVLCYANADILFFPDIAVAAQRALDGGGPFLVIGRRWNFDAPDEEFADRDWRRFILSTGKLYNGFNLDYFLFPKPFFGSIPPFAVGRPAWDNWMIYEARRMGMTVIDSTAALLAGHQNHDYSHTREGREGGKSMLWNGPEAEENRRLAGKHYFGIQDATHVMGADGGIRRRFAPLHGFVRWREAPEIYPGSAWFWGAVRWGVEFLLGIQHRLRLWLLARGVDTFPHKAKRAGARG
jgi:hypothetical protein